MLAALPTLGAMPGTIACSCGSRVDVGDKSVLDDVICPECGCATTITPRLLKGGAPARNDDSPSGRIRREPTDAESALAAAKRETEEMPAPVFDGGDGANSSAGRAVPKATIDVLRFRLEGSMVAGRRLPPIDFGDVCICCNSPNARREAVDVADEGYQPVHMEIPYCANCRDHARPTSRMAIVLGGIWLVFVIVLAGVGQWLAALALGLVGGAIVAAIEVTGARTRRELRARGHHPTFDTAIVGRHFIVYTENPRLATDLRSRYADWIAD